MQRCGRRVLGRGNGMCTGTAGNWIGRFQEEQWPAVTGQECARGERWGDEYHEESGSQCYVGPGL